MWHSQLFISKDVENVNNTLISHVQILRHSWSLIQFIVNFFLQWGTDVNSCWSIIRKCFAYDSVVTDSAQFFVLREGYNKMFLYFYFLQFPMRRSTKRKQKMDNRAMGQIQCENGLTQCFWVHCSFNNIVIQVYAPFRLNLHWFVRLSIVC